MIQPDEVITLPSGAELSIKAAQGDISRALSYWNDVEDEVGEGLAADLLHVVELLDWLRERVNAPDLLEAAKRAASYLFGAAQRDEDARAAIAVLEEAITAAEGKES